MNADTILGKLPAFEGKKKLIKTDQTVSDIVKEVCEAHLYFSDDYDLICTDFVGPDQVQTLKNLFTFLKTNVKYVEEPAESQTTKSPAAILQTGVCDCKGYSLFIGGVLDALNRLGGNYEWGFAFAGYGKKKKVRHVFVWCQIGPDDYWIDPVLSEFNQRYPQPTFLSCKVPDMAIHRLSGVGYVLEDSGPMYANGEAVKQSALIPMESVDQQLIRITKLPQMEATIAPDAADTGILVDYPSIQTAIKTTKPIDSFPEPGQGLTTAAPSQVYTLTNGKAPGTSEPVPVEGEPEDKSWFEKNKKMVIGGAALLALLLLSNKK